jgi:type 1 glutamine amidotransferase
MRSMRLVWLAFAATLMAISPILNAQEQSSTLNVPAAGQAQTSPSEPGALGGVRQVHRSPDPHGLGYAASGYVQNPTIDKDPPELPADLKPGGILIFSKTNGFRDEPAIETSDAVLSAIAMEKGWPYCVTENGAVMNPGQLKQFKLVIWNNTSGDTLSDDQRAAFKTWMENGGSFLGIHGAGGDPAGLPAPRTAAVWKWYVDTLVGAQFIGHSSIMPGDIHVEDRSPLTKDLPPDWHRSEEWYGFAENPRGKRGFHIIATVDEKTYRPGRTTMGGDHPLVWWHCVGNGHSMYSALGHGATMYAEPLMIRFLDHAVSWGMAKSGHSCSSGK